MSIRKKKLNVLSTTTQNPSKLNHSFNLNTLFSTPISLLPLFLILLFVRVTSVFYSTIQDCDEVYNYWEPLHFLQFNSGLQTWEYSPEYGLRSYAYLLLHYIPLRMIQLFTKNKILLFYFLKSIFAILSSCCEIFLIHNIKLYHSIELSNYVYLFLIFNSGMQHGAIAFLPSTFAMLTTTLYFSFSFNQYQSNNKLIINLILLAVGALWGWPFSAAIGIPYVLEWLLIQNNYDIVNGIFKVVKYSVRITLAVGIPLLLVDSYFYQKLIIVPFNIVFYNVLAANKEAGPDIFGVEEWYYYLINGILNFNIGFVLAIMSLFIGLLSMIIQKNINLKIVFKLIPFYWWLLIFSFQPHKEERFLYPIYPIILVNAAITLIYYKSIIIQIIDIDFIKNNKIVQQGLIKLYKWSIYIMFLIYIILSFSRSYGQFKYYYGDIKLYKNINQFNNNNNNNNNSNEVILCLGDEWYKYPSTYFLQSNVQLKFIHQNFNGLLPQPYLKNSKHWYQSTSIILNNNNNKNQLIKDRFIPITKCNFIIASLSFDNVQNNNEVNYSISDSNNYTINYNQNQILHCEFILDKSSLPSWRRAFYFPEILFKRKIKFNQQCLIKLD
ncbi:hypothetical protein K502DRAFT_361729 [Neoconidiobolus thromboides FSU 785]|nr:hypothetical protein K502DRAFT_361729 [Neoconidiobolus thromboides FSU 785]